MLIELALILLMGGLAGLMNIPSDDDIKSYQGSWIGLWGRVVLIGIATLVLVIASLTYRR